MHTKSSNIETMIGNEINEIMEELFESLLQRRLGRTNERK